MYLDIFTIKFDDLTKEQRKLFADMYFYSNQGIPASINLSLPTINRHDPKKISLATDKFWEVKFDPQKVESKELLERWRKEYTEELEKLQKQLNDNKTEEKPPS